MPQPGFVTFRNYKISQYSYIIKGLISRPSEPLPRRSLSRWETTSPPVQRLQRKTFFLFRLANFRPKERKTPSLRRPEKRGERGKENRLYPDDNYSTPRLYKLTLRWEKLTPQILFFEWVNECESPIQRRWCLVFYQKQKWRRNPCQTKRKSSGIINPRVFPCPRTMGIDASRVGSESRSRRNTYNLILDVNETRLLLLPLPRTFSGTTLEEHLLYRIHWT